MPVDNKDNPKVCKECGRETSRVIRTTCRACYQKKRAATMPNAECHPDRKEHAGKLCRQCYKAGERAPRAKCHPDKPHAAKGLCAECYRALPENKERAIKARRLKKYGLSEEEYDSMFDEQGGACAICGDEAAVVDHNHETGAVRGLLCILCNAGLGQFRDSPPLLVKATTYLEERSHYECVSI